MSEGILRWVRSYAATRSRRPFYDAVGETQAAAWIAFFASNIGMFLRNAVIYNYPGGMVQFYKDHGVIPQTPIASGILNQGYENYGIHPSANEIPNSHWGIAASLAANIPIYGWFTPTEAISDGSPYWLLIADNRNRLCWLESKAIDHNAGLLNSQNEADAISLSPERSFASSDLLTIIGE